MSMHTQPTKPETTKNALKEWISSHNCSVQAEQISDDTKIIEQRMITSMQVMDLILYIESLKGGPVDPSQIKQGSFQTIDDMYQAFFIN